MNDEHLGPDDIIEDFKLINERFEKFNKLK